jgi:hypothetical protein
MCNASITGTHVNKKSSLSIKMVCMVWIVQFNMSGGRDGRSDKTCRPDLITALSVGASTGRKVVFQATASFRITPMAISVRHIWLSMTKIPCCVSEYPNEAATIGQGLLLPSRSLNFAMRTLTTPTIQRTLRSPRPSYTHTARAWT